MDWYFVGVDLGQSRDYTAIAVVERAETRGEFDHAVWAHRREVSLRMRYLERVPLGTPYPDVVEQIVKLTRAKELARHCHLAVDATGVGRPVVDLLRRAEPPAILMPVTITGGDRETAADGFYRVPKRDLIVQLQVLLQSGGLHIASRLPYARKLVEEMMAMEVKIGPSGSEQYAAWREGTHDDLVFAVALAYWSAQKIFPRGPEGDARWWVGSGQEDGERMFRRWMGDEARKWG